jgi:hypothetical protein
MGDNNIHYESITRFNNSNALVVAFREKFLHEKRSKDDLDTKE